MKKRSRKLLSLLLVLAMAFGMISVTSAAESGQISTAVQSNEEAAAAPAPKFDSWNNLKNSSATYYEADDGAAKQLWVEIKRDNSSYTVDTLTVNWQVSDDGINFTDIEDASAAFNSNLYSYYTPDIKAGETKYYRAAVTNKGLTEGMTPTTVYSYVATIAFKTGERPGLLIEKPMLRQSDGTLISDATVSAIQLYGGNNALPRKITGVGTYTGELARFYEGTYDTDKYAFCGWQIDGTFYSGTADQESAVNAVPTEANGWKSFINGDGWYFSMYRETYNLKSQYRLQFAGEKVDEGALSVLKVIPVFEAKADMAYKITMTDSTGGKVQQVRADGETHTLRAKADSLYQFSHWEQSSDGETWTAIEGGTETQVTLTADTFYRAVFESPYNVTGLEVKEYALPSEGDTWYLNVGTTVDQALPDYLIATVSVYDGETADEEHLLGSYNARLTTDETQMTNKVKMKKRPSGNNGKILVVMNTATGKTAQTVYQLKGTLDASASKTTVDPAKAFVGAEPAEVQLSASGNPAVKSVLWSGGDSTLGTNNSSVVNEHTGLVTYSPWNQNRSVDYTVRTGDGRYAEVSVSYKMTVASKINANVLKVTAGETKEFDAVNVPSPLDRDRYKVTAVSSDEDIFKVEMVTKTVNPWTAKNAVVQYKITAVKTGTAKLTISTNFQNNPVIWECPVVIQSADIPVTGLTLSTNKTELTRGDSMTLEAAIVPETSLTTITWESSDPKTVSVEDGKITGLKTGSATITATATDAKNNKVTATCEVTVTKPVYSVELYVPKNTVGENGLTVYPTTGKDESGKDTFAADSAVSGMICDTESNQLYDIYAFTAPEGTYSYRAVSADGKSLGGGAFSFPNSAAASVDGKTARITLRLAEVFAANEFDGKKAEAKDFIAGLTNEVSAVTMGDVYTNADGYAVYPALISVNGSMTYYMTLVPSAEYRAARNLMEYRKQDVTAEKDASVLKLSAEMAAGCFTVNAPSDAEVFICEQMSDGIVKEYKPDGTAAQEDGTVDYQFHIAITDKMFYRVTGDSYVTYNGTVADGSTEHKTVTAEMLNPSGASKITLDRNTASNCGANMGDLYLNVNAQGYLKLDAGSSYQLNAQRNWWGSNVTWVLGKDYRLIQPDFHYQVVDLDGQASDSVIKVNSDGTVTAVGAGTAIVLVTYDSMTLNYHDEIKYSYDNYDPNGFYGAIWPEDTGVFVVSVDAGNSGIKTGMTLNADLNKDTSKEAGAAIDAELDPIYFTGDQGEYQFTPETEGVSVSVANPTMGANSLSFSGFKTLSANEDGSYTVPLTNGRNIVKVEKSGNAEYQVITGKQISVKVNGKSLEDAVVAPGENVSVTFDTLFNPVTRMSLYNTDAAAMYRSISGMDGKIAGTARGSYGYYFFGSTAEKQTITNLVEEETDASGYNNPIVSVKDALTVPEDFQGDQFVLSNGTFNVAGFGADYGGHRAGVKTWGNLSPNTLAYMGKLPDLSITVGTLDKIEVTAQPSKTEYHVGEAFDPAGMTVTASYTSSNGTITREIDGYTFSQDAFTEAGEQKVTITYTQGKETKTAEVAVQVKEAQVEKIEVTTLPTKTVYHAGETFDPSGMVVTAAYSDGTTREVTDYTVAPTTIAADTESVEVSYNGKTASVPIQLSKVASIAVTKMPAKTEYTEGELFDPAGMSVEITYQDGTIEETTNYSYAPTGHLTTDDTEITISYAGADAVDGIAAAKIAVTVNKKDTDDGESIQVTVSYSRGGAFVSGSEGTLLSKAPVTVYDTNGDGRFTMSDAFRSMHREYYNGGTDGYADTESGWITRVWGVNTGMVSYVLNHSWVFGTTEEIHNGDDMALYEYVDTTTYSDLYTYFDSDSYTADPGTATTFTVTGVSVMNSGKWDNENVTNVIAAPVGATVTVYDHNGAVVEGLTATTDENGQFTLTFPKDEVYTIEVSGICDYTCAGWAGSGNTTYKSAPVVPARCKVTVGKGAGLLGDVNGDGQVTLADAIRLLDQVTAGENDILLAVGDMDGDGQITLVDAIALLDFVTANQN